MNKLLCKVFILWMRNIYSDIEWILKVQFDILDFIYKYDFLRHLKITQT